MSGDSDYRFVKKDEYLIRNGAYLFKELVKSSHGKINPFRIFSLEELKEATNDFKCYTSLNSHHRTYRGIIEGRCVAVKIPRHFRYSMMDEAVCLSLIKHRNVVKLLGCCLETDFPIVVHELPPNGTLEEYIFPEKLIPPPVELSWTDRLRIATEIADALSYLHSELHITHGRLWDFRVVLLDEFLSAKLSSFDYSQIQKQTGSSDVELDNIRNKLRKREDAHDFGKILLNLLGIDDGEVRKCKEKVEILKYLKLNVSKKEMPQVEACIDLFLRCRSSLKLRRWEIDYKRMKEIVGEEELSMEEVARELRCIKSMINPQPTTDGNESDNLSSGAN